MPDIAIRITNLPEIKAAFSKAPILMTAELDLAIKKSIFTIERDAKQLAPVDTGRLRASIQSKFTTLKGQTGANVDYDIYVQLGTKYQRAQPYLFTAVADNEVAIQGLFKLAVQNVLDKIARDV